METGSRTFVKASFLLSRCSSCGCGARTWSKVRGPDMWRAGKAFLLREGCHVFCWKTHCGKSSLTTPLSGVSIRKGLKWQVQLIAKSARRISTRLLMIDLSELLAGPHLQAPISFRLKAKGNFTSLDSAQYATPLHLQPPLPLSPLVHSAPTTLACSLLLK